MNVILIVQITVVAVFAAALLIYTYEFFRYQRLRKIFSEDYLRMYGRKAIRGYYPFIPRYGSKRYTKAALFIAKIGWEISVERLYAGKWAMFFIGLIIACGIQTTNRYIMVDQIKEDTNYRKIIIDNYTIPTPASIRLELELFRLTEENLNRSKDIYDSKKNNIYLEYVQNLLIESGIKTEEGIETLARRMIEKVKTVRDIENDIGVYLWGMLISTFLYILPDFLGRIKLKLIEDKKDWEVLYCIYAFSIFGRLMPYSAKMVLESMSMVTSIYKSLLNGLLEGVKKGAGAKAFDDALNKTANDDLYELLETMKLASDTGILNAVGDIDVLAEQKLKWMEIRGITRRNQKRLYAMTLVAIMFLFAGIYFSYGLTIIANPSNMIPK